MKKASLILVAIIVGCDRKDVVRVEGETMATTYHVTYFGSRNFKKEIDSLLFLVNRPINTYGADVIANFLKSKDVEDMFVEFGGERLAPGHNLYNHREVNATLKEHPELDAFIVYLTSEGSATYATPGIADQIEINP
jgi:thiamine biosynthesis lipoprotein ApbE